MRGEEKADDDLFGAAWKGRRQDKDTQSWLGVKVCLCSFVVCTACVVCYVNTGVHCELEAKGNSSASVGGPAPFLRESASPNAMPLSLVPVLDLWPRHCTTLSVSFMYFLSWRLWWP